MKRFTFVVIFLFITVGLIASQEKISVEHKNWLETVSPIITKAEREVFLKLRTNRERDKFIRLFWLRRDPLPETRENEFFQDYMKRVHFADTNFGYGSVKKGSQTERGYFYLLLGPPLERQIYATSSELWPLELWYYKGEQQYGLPPYFYLIFYQPQGMGEYRLYQPGMEGPEKLVVPSSLGRLVTRANAYQAIKKISGELAGASLSYLPGETSFGESSFSSSTIISAAYSLPEKKFSDSYARDFLYYKDYIETDYTHDFIDSSYKVKVFKNNGQFFVHWALEPSKINFVSYQGRYYATFELILRIEDLEGNLVLEKEEEIPLRITPEEYKQHERRLFAFQDIVPLIPGKFKLFFLLKSKTARDFASFRSDIIAGYEQGQISMSSLILYHNKEALGVSQKKKLKAFTFDGDQYVINAQNNFLPQEKMGIYCQVYNVAEKNTKSFVLEIFPMNSETAVLRQKRSLSEILAPDGEGIDTGPVELSALNPGYYTVKASILDEKEKPLLAQKENFLILSQPFGVVPWIYAKLHNPMPDPELLYTLASQYFLTQHYAEARKLLEQALSQKSEPKTRLLLGKTLYALGQFEDSLTLVFPVYHSTQEREAAKLIAANYAALKEWSAALVYLERLLEDATEISVLNLAAECYLNLGQTEKALPLLEKSLELNPDQPKIKELERKVKKHSNH